MRERREASKAGRKEGCKATSVNSRKANWCCFTKKNCNIPQSHYALSMLWGSLCCCGTPTPDLCVSSHT